MQTTSNQIRVSTNFNRENSNEVNGSRREGILSTPTFNRPGEYDDLERLEQELLLKYGECSINRLVNKRLLEKSKKEKHGSEVKATTPITVSSNVGTSNPRFNQIQGDTPDDEVDGVKYTDGIDMQMRIEGEGSQGNQGLSVNANNPKKSSWVDVLGRSSIASCEGKAIAIRIFTAEELMKATYNYDDRSYKGIATVYNGNLEGQIVAVKTPER
ncbi:hypothetical protein FRX31_029802 [Thalictrum thalictroides]|uniref:Uncharacterized protein n=1 Tax=Thalictrum thalictroides TaxID=46969 RepID=A0A7J6V8T3_THATH|nr:hypothetical protein FRX31_029802 [Thalictrum thalictroides]